MCQRMSSNLVRTRHTLHTYIYQQADWTGYQSTLQEPFSSRFVAQHGLIPWTQKNASSSYLKMKHTLDVRKAHDV